MNDFGKLIKLLRQRNGLTQKDLAIRLGTDDSTISKWERNKNLPDVTMVVLIAEVLNVTCDDLLHPTEALEKLKVPMKKDDVIGTQVDIKEAKKVASEAKLIYITKRWLLVFSSILFTLILICACCYHHLIKRSDDNSTNSQFQLVESRTNVESAKGPAYELIYIYPDGTSRDSLVSHAESISDMWRNGGYIDSAEETLIVSYYSSIENINNQNATSFRIYFLKNPPQ